MSISPTVTSCNGCHPERIVEQTNLEILSVRVSKNKSKSCFLRGVCNINRRFYNDSLSISHIERSGNESCSSRTATICALYTKINVVRLCNFVSVVYYASIVLALCYAVCVSGCYKVCYAFAYVCKVTIGVAKSVRNIKVKSRCARGYGAVRNFVPYACALSKQAYFFSYFCITNFEFNIFG